jgi:hypothetical protein
MNFILAVRSEIRIMFEGWRFAASHVQGLWQARDKDSEVFAKYKAKNSS